jgi:hypothetical protein
MYSLFNLLWLVRLNLEKGVQEYIIQLPNVLLYMNIELLLFIKKKKKKEKKRVTTKQKYPKRHFKIVT